MKVSELMDLLKKVNPDATVVFGNVRLSGNSAEMIREVNAFTEVGTYRMKGEELIELDPGSKCPINYELNLPTKKQIL